MNTASKTYGQWYAHVKTVETMNTRKGISGTVLTDHFSRQMKMKQKSIQTISKCWTSENDRENRPRESPTPSARQTTGVRQAKRHPRGMPFSLCYRFCRRFIKEPNLSAFFASPNFANWFQFANIGEYTSLILESNSPVVEIPFVESSPIPGVAAFQSISTAFIEKPPADS